MPWSGTGIDDTVLSPQGYVTVPDKAYQEACIHSWEEGLAKAEQIGWPVMIKASEGGGGKGIRKVDDGEKFKTAFQAVVGEVPGASIRASFPDVICDLTVCRLAHLCHEASRFRSTSRSPAHCRSIR
jgi:acetyl-CoA carboxylase/biotin carboxylase 1